jgi:hypothetical protein
MMLDHLPRRPSFPQTVSLFGLAVVVSSEALWLPSQVTVQVNAAPSSGSCGVSASSGTALLDRFTASCNGWVDPEGTAATLTYTFVLLGGALQLSLGPTSTTASVTVRGKWYQQDVLRKSTRHG